MSPLLFKLKSQLDQRTDQGALRQLKYSEGLIDFCSNDYLGFARSEELHQSILEKVQHSPLAPRTGSTGSRLISGHYPIIEELEDQIAQFHQAPSGLLFNSGYDLNVGLLSCVPQRGDTVLYDQWVHASMRDGLRMGQARSYSFRHNDLEHLKEKLTQAQGTVFIAVESVYSMDGDFAPLEELVNLCQEVGAYLIVDEAHATGIFGELGQGRVYELGLQDQVFARIHTFGKAMGTHGAVALSDPILKQFLINYARPLIYSTALPIHSLLSIQSAYETLKSSSDTIQKLHKRIQFFQSQLCRLSDMSFLKSDSPIQGALISGNQKVRQIAQSLQDDGFDVRPILSPTVPEGTERLRICLHAYNSQQEIQALLDRLHETWKKTS